MTEIKTAALGNVITIHGNQEDLQKQTEVIDLNIKTNLTVSNSKGSKIVQKLFFVLVLFITVTFAILYFNVRKEIQALKSQVINLLIHFLFFFSAIDNIESETIDTHTLQSFFFLYAIFSLKRNRKKDCCIKANVFVLHANKKIFFFPLNLMNQIRKLREREKKKLSGLR